jgi:hypothetical protein
MGGRQQPKCRGHTTNRRRGQELKVTRVINHARVAAVVTAVILMSQYLCFNASAQHSQIARTANQSRDERVRRILESLEQDNTLRFALERGDRGSDVHYAWMDKMQQRGVRQASFRIRFHWGEKSKKLKIEDAKYLRQYYRFDTTIDDQSIIEQIRASGLEKELRDEILRRAEANLAWRMNDLRSSQICGMLYLNLLDDEVLPILDYPPDLDDKCEATGRQ